MNIFIYIYMFVFKYLLAGWAERDIWIFGGNWVRRLLVCKWEWWRHGNPAPIEIATAIKASEMQINSPELKPTSINYWGKVTRADGVGGGGAEGDATTQRPNGATTWLMTAGWICKWALICKLPFGWWMRICTAMRRIGKDRRDKWLHQFISSEPIEWFNELLTSHSHTHTLTHTHTLAPTHTLGLGSLVASCAALWSLERLGSFLYSWASRCSFVLLCKWVELVDGWFQRWRWWFRKLPWWPATSPGRGLYVTLPCLLVNESALTNSFIH